MRVVVVGALYGLSAVALGAVGTHVLAGTMTPTDEGAFQTAVMFQLLHAAVMVAMGGLKPYMLPALLGAASWAIGRGVLLFCGSLFAAAFGAPTEIAFIAPLGGGLLLLGWLLLAIGAARRL